MDFKAVKHRLLAHHWHKNISVDSMTPCSDIQWRRGLRHLTQSLQAVVVRVLQVVVSALAPLPLPPLVGGHAQLGRVDRVDARHVHERSWRLEAGSSRSSQNFFVWWYVALDVTAICICEIHCLAIDGFVLNTVHKLSSKEKTSRQSWDSNPGLRSTEEAFLLPTPATAPGSNPSSAKFCAAGWKARMLPLCYAARPPPMLELSIT